MEPIVDTTHGKLQGIEQDGYLAFRGIPYAAPPTGHRRFLPPEPAERWDGTRPATEYGAICPQNPSPLEDMLGGREKLPQDEDCLTLNVWTSGLDDARRPVMVWIHGGAFIQGSGRVPWYDGRHFARSGVVLVTINYRLGPLGFLHTTDRFGDEFTGSANAGILDQIAAITWVRENARAFGGDPDNITLFGESAGGMSVGTLLATPKARGLFHKAIPQSGACHNSHSPEMASKVTDRLLAEAGVQPGDGDALRELPIDRLLAGTLAVTTLAGTDPKALFGEDMAGVAIAFQPLVDGRTLDRRPIDAVRDGAAAGIPVLVGTTRDEWGLFTAMLPPEALKHRVPRPMRNLFERAGRDPEQVADTYVGSLPQRSPVALRNALETDRVFRMPGIRLAEAQSANGAAAWMYLFSWRTPAFGGKLGACHALEIPFVFNNLAAPGVSAFCGESPPQPVADAMHRSWVAFATNGDPNHEEIPDWPRYDTDRRATMVFDETCAVDDDPEGERRRIWEGIL